MSSSIIFVSVKMKILARFLKFFPSWEAFTLVFFNSKKPGFSQAIGNDPSLSAFLSVHTSWFFFEEAGARRACTLAKGMCSYGCSGTVHRHLCASVLTGSLLQNSKDTQRAILKTTVPKVPWAPRLVWQMTDVSEPTILLFFIVTCIFPCYQ